jgi:O-antigen/teichoic acid export membrane protein
MALIGTVAAVAIVGVAIVSPSSIGPALLTVAIALTMATSADWVLRGLERMVALGNEIMLGGLTALAGSIVLFATSGSTVAGLTVILAGEIVATCAAWAWAGTVPRLRLEPHEIRVLLRRSWPLAISSLAMYSYYANLDTILLAAMRSAEEAGLYSAPYRVFLGLNAISIYTAYSYLPLLTRGVESGDHGPAFAALRRGVRYLLIYGALLLAGAELAGGELLGLLFGPEFEGTGDVFVVLCLAIMWFSVGYPVGYALIARDQNRRFLAGAATGGGLNLALNLVLIPPFGTIGAAASTAGAFIAACLVWLWGNGLLGRDTAREIAAMSAISVAAVASLIDDRLRPAAIALTVLLALLFSRPLFQALAARRREG